MCSGQTFYGDQIICLVFHMSSSPHTQHYFATVPVKMIIL